jgi:hypothetical protein
VNRSAGRPWLRLGLVAATLLVAGCTQQQAEQLRPVSPVTGLEGPPAYKLRCPYEAQCVQRAEALCPNGYRTLDNVDGVYGVAKVVQCR